MRNDFSKAVLSTLMKERRYSHLYINVVRMNNGEWSPAWREKFLAATTLSRAQEMRREFLLELRGVHPETGRPIRKFWTKDRVKTIKIF